MFSSTLRSGNKVPVPSYPGTSYIAVKDAVLLFHLLFSVFREQVSVLGLAVEVPAHDVPAVVDRLGAAGEAVRIIDRCVGSAAQKKPMRELAVEVVADNVASGVDAKGPGALHAIGISDVGKGALVEQETDQIAGTVHVPSDDVAFAADAERPAAQAVWIIDGRVRALAEQKPVDLKGVVLEKTDNVPACVDAKRLRGDGVRDSGGPLRSSR